jgi:hypothetical protein
MRWVSLLAGAVVVGVALAAAVSGMAARTVVPPTVFRDAVGDVRGSAKPTADIRAVEVAEPEGSLAFTVRFAKPLLGGEVVRIQVDGDRDAKTGWQAGAFRRGVDLAAVVTVVVGGSPKAHAGWVKRNAALPVRALPVPPSRFHVSMQARALTVAFDRAAIFRPPAGVAAITVGKPFRFLVDTVWVRTSASYDRSPDSGWHTYTLRPTT